MAALPVTSPYVLKTATAEFELDGEVKDWSSHINEVRLTPTTQSQTWTAINGTVISDSSPATWAATLSLVQDLDAGGFMRWLLDHEGEKATCLFTFKDGTDPCLITLALSPTDIGGAAAGPIAEASVTLPADGRPDFDAGHTLPTPEAA